MTRVPSYLIITIASLWLWLGGLTSAVAQDATAQNRVAVVVIDPGHGGKDPGAIGRSKTYEKDVVLATSKRLQKLIEADPGMRAVLTRDDDSHITLRERLEFARKHKADIVVSIHADSYTSPSVSGASVYILSNKGVTNEAKRLLDKKEKKENTPEATDATLLQDTDEDVASILVDLSQTSALNHSRALAGSIVRSLGRIARSQRIARAEFVVLKLPDAASALIELGYMSNDQDEQNLKQPAYQKQLAHAIFTGMKNYLTRYGARDLKLPNRSHTSYTVQRGDTLSGIARRYQTSVTTIKNASGITSDTIQIGQKLKIPARP